MARRDNEHRPQTEEGALSPATGKARQLQTMNRFAVLFSSLLYASLCQVSLAADSSRVFYPEQVAWKRVEMTASKFLMSMDAYLELDNLTPDSLESLLILPLSEAEKAPLGAPTQLSYVTDGLGRRTESRLMLDGRRGKALQRMTLRQGGSEKYRIYRFSEDRIHRLTWRPGPGEEGKDPDTWSRLSEEYYEYPEMPSGTAPVVTEASALIYLAAASGMSQPGEALEALTLASDEFFLTRLEVRQPEEARVSYSRVDQRGSSMKIGRVRAVRIAIEARPLDSRDGEDFELFGLSDLELILDPETRAPLELRGRVDFFGDVAFRLDRLVLASAKRD